MLRKIYQLSIIGILLSMLFFNLTLAGDEKDKTLPRDSKFVVSQDIYIKLLAKDVWRYICFKKLKKYGWVPANGLVVSNGNKSAVLIDLPWTNEQTATLFNWIEENLNLKVEYVIPTHSHIDCMGGIAEAHKRGAKSFAFEKTAQFARVDGLTLPHVVFRKNYILKTGSLKLILDYLGGGHTHDNIVVWIPQKKILFGGCLVKTYNAKNLGFTKEADLSQWPQTIKKVMKKYSDARIIVPGHGKPGGKELLERTLFLLEQNK